MATKHIDYSIFFNTSQDLLAVLNLQGCLNEVNEFWIDLTGYSYDELNMEGLKILLVDDSEKNRNLVKFFLAKSKVNIIARENGLEALNRFKKGDIDLVLMDMQMPVRDGYTATSKIREFEAQDKIPPVPIIALTAFALKGEKQKIFEAGCDAHLTKPIKTGDLINSIFKFSQKAA
ncbi:MAG: response regulator [Bdellovibrionales bacterium]